METIILLYYRMPYENEPDLICACDSQASVNKKIYSLRSQYPDAYPEMSRFETSRVEFVRSNK
jgi:hypothetical protein